MRTALTKTVSGPVRVILVDDASPEWSERWADQLRAELGVVVIRFDEHGGLTRSWNEGLRAARELGAVYAVATNSDVVFARGWDVPIVAALDERGMALVGPVTNAPGTEDAQDVSKHYIRPYTVDDDQSHIDMVGRRLTEDFGSEVRQSTVNGFCMMARTETWWANSFDDVHVFKPRNDYNSRGQVNADPFNTLQEYELQARWHARGLKTGFCPGSFVWHYRSITRGDRFKTPGWYRPPGGKAP